MRLKLKNIVKFCLYSKVIFNGRITLVPLPISPSTDLEGPMAQMEGPMKQWRDLRRDG